MEALTPWARTAKLWNTPVQPPQTAIGWFLFDTAKLNEEQENSPQFDRPACRVTLACSTIEGGSVDFVEGESLLSFLVESFYGGSPPDLRRAPLRPRRHRSIVLCRQEH